MDDSPPIVSQGSGGHSLQFSVQTNSAEKTVSLVEDEGLEPPGSQRVYLALWMLGCGYLFPYNSVITAVDFFDHKFPGIVYYFTVAFATPNIIFLGLSIRFGLPGTTKIRVVLGYIVQLSLLMIMPFVGNAVLAVALVLGMGFGTALLQGSLSELAGRLPPKMMSGLLSGTGMSGLIICGLRIITKANFESDDDGRFLSTLIYIICACSAVFFCVIVFLLVVDRSPYVKHYVRMGQGNLARSSNASNSLGVEDPLLDDGRKGSNASEKSSSNTSSFVFKEVRPLALSVLMNFIVTLALFPGLLTEMDSQSSTLGDGWYPIVLITMFNFCDVLGKAAPTIPRLLFVSDRSVPALVCCRLAFVPIFILAVNPKVLEADAFMYVAIALMGFTNGYLGTLAMMYGPAKVGVADKGKAGTIMIFFLTLGLTGGAVTGIFLKYAVTGKF